MRLLAGLWNFSIAFSIVKERSVHKEYFVILLFSPFIQEVLTRFLAFHPVLGDTSSGEICSCH